MSNSDLTSIRERLETLKRTSEASLNVPEPWQSPRSPELPKTQPGREYNDQSQFAATVEALQSRSGQTATQVNPKPTTTPPTIPHGVALHWQRLQQEAVTINELSQQQMVALQNFKRSADSLAWTLRKQPADSTLTLEQLCELQDAIIPQVFQDSYGKITLSSTPVDLYQDERYASQTAEEVRAFSQSRRQTSQPNESGIFASAGNPLRGIGLVWRGLTSTIEARSRLSPLDIGAWFGGGLIGRLVLELLLAASPGLWPLLIGGMVGIVALALYRLLAIPEPDIAFVGRLFLALVGLALGGQL